MKAVVTLFPGILSTEMSFFTSFHQKKKKKSSQLQIAVFFPHIHRGFEVGKERTDPKSKEKRYLQGERRWEHRCSQSRYNRMLVRRIQLGALTNCKRLYWEQHDTVKSLKTQKWVIFAPYRTFTMSPQGRKEKRSEKNPSKCPCWCRLGHDRGGVRKKKKKKLGAKIFLSLLFNGDFCSELIFLFLQWNKCVNCGGGGGNSNTADLKILVTPHYSWGMRERGD